MPDTYYESSLTGDEIESVLTGAVVFNDAQDLTDVEKGRARANIGALSEDGTVASAVKLETARTIRTNLASTTAASFDGTANVTPGVTGVLPRTNGGTGTNSEILKRVNLEASGYNVILSPNTTDIPVIGTLPIANGGTGATDAGGALIAFGAADVGTVEYATGNAAVHFTDGYYIQNNGSTININSPTADSNWKLAVVACSAGDEFFLWGAAGYSQRLYSFSDSSSNILEVAGQYANGYRLKVTAPANSAYLVINCNKNSSSTIAAYKNEAGIQITKRVGGSVEELKIARNNYPARTVRGPIACLKSAAKQGLSHFIIPVAATQTGSGDPSPSNQRPIVQPSTLGVYVSDDIVAETDAGFTGDSYLFNLSGAGEGIGSGTFDAATGKLTIEYGVFTITKDTPMNLNWGQNRLYFELTTKKPAAGLEDPKVICDRAPRGATSQSTTSAFSITVGGSGANGKNVFVNGLRQTGATTSAEFLTWLTSHPITFTYPLKDPIVVYLDHQSIIPRFETNYIWTSQHDPGISNEVEYMPDAVHMYDTPSGSFEYVYYATGTGTKTSTYTKLCPSEMFHTSKPIRICVQTGWRSGYTTWATFFNDDGTYFKAYGNTRGDLYIPAGRNFYLSLGNVGNTYFPHPANGDSAEVAFGYAKQVCQIYNEAVTIYSEDWTDVQQQRLNLQLSTLAVFPTIGACGDSFTLGSIHHTPDDTSAGVYPDQCWGKVLGRMMGVNVSIFARGNTPIKGWLIYDKGLPALLAADPQKLYIIAFGINDNKYIGDEYPPNSGETYELGTVADCDTQSANYGKTFYGCYAKAINEILNHAPDAKIVCLSVFRRNERQLDPCIQEIAEEMGLPYINLSDDAYFCSEAWRDGEWGDSLHPTAVGYGGMANAINRLISLNMADNARGYWLNYYGDPSV